MYVDDPLCILSSQGCGGGHSVAAVSCDDLLISFKTPLQKISWCELDLRGLR